MINLFKKKPIYCKDCKNYNLQWSLCNIRRVCPVTGDLKKVMCSHKNYDYNCKDFIQK